MRLIRKRKRGAALLGAGVILLSACSGAGPSADAGQGHKTAEVQSSEQGGQESGGTALDLMRAYNVKAADMPDDAYRSYYEVFVGSFRDGDGDGMGDFKGLTESLDYIRDQDPGSHEDLNCNGIWLMPIMPSPTYHKYDVTDYMAIDPAYGSMEDFESFLSACEERDIHVLVDLVLNHTSSDHPWFTEACRYLEQLGDGQADPAVCPYVEYYHFDKKKVSGSWYQVGTSEWYYEGKFWSGMPDLNWECEGVRKEFQAITSFWLDKGVSGFRVDAAKEFVSDNTTANIEILRWLNDTVKGHKEDAYLVAEVWTSSEVYEAYYESGIDSVFNFAFAAQEGVIASVLNGVGGKGADFYGKAVEALDGRMAEIGGLDAPFYTNHDVARSAGYYSGEDGAAKTKLAQAMNLFMGGSAFLYYGEELGMKGSGKDENKRAPMYWTKDASAEGMCKGPAGMDSIKMKYGSLEEQEEDGNSVYTFVREAESLRAAYPAIARGRTDLVEELSDAEMIVTTKTYGDKQIALVWNLSPAEKSLDMTGIGMDQVGGLLLTGEDTIEVKEHTLTLPAYSIVLLEK